MTTTPNDPSPDTEPDIVPSGEPEPENPDVKDGQVSETAAGGTVSDGDAPTGDPDLAGGEQPDPGTEPHESDDQEED